MSTTRTADFAAMINEYLPNKLMQQELKKRDFLFNQVEEDKNWKLGNYIVPFTSAVSSSVKFGSLTDLSDISKEKEVRGVISAHKEVWGTMLFEAKDIMINDKISEQNFLRILPDQIERHMNYFKQVLGQNFLSGSAIEELTANGTAGGLATVGNPERYELDQLLNFSSDVVVGPIVGYVSAINVNTGVLTIVTARGGATPVDLSTLLTVDNAKVYNDAQKADGFSSVIDLLKPLSAGGPANIYGVAKTSTKYTQAIHVDGSAFVAADLLKNIFKTYVKIRKVGGGKPNQVLMSYNNYAACVNAIENQKGAFNVIPMTSKMEVFAWDQITVGGFLSNGEPVTLVALQEMNDSDMIFFDKSTFVIASNGGLRKHKTPDGIEFYTTRQSTGYKYVIDTCLMGDLICKAPYKNGIVTGLNITY